MTSAVDLCLVTILLCYESASLQNNFQNTLTTPDLSARDSTCITLGQNVTFESKLEKVSLLSGIVKTFISRCMVM